MRSQLAMTWGTETFIVPKMESTDGMIRQVDKSLLELGRYKRATWWSSSRVRLRARSVPPT
ncbi:pyruvate kinase domain protein [Mycobacterium kansasii]|uniref:Pyruvate kinase domain protein n=1 Tax=Mycobacterium kansasii TaxID=1768 RepID=A0A1V3WHV1_MYCKA|nr:pyruvate kinase domain protein [Mycobacterium kansasii]